MEDKYHYGFIYIIKNDINNKIYIGKTTAAIKKRFMRHCEEGKRETNIHSIDYAINKYGTQHFWVEELEKCPLSILSEREIYWIQYYNSYKKGYNLTLGGEGMLLYTEEEISKAIQMYQDGFLITDIESTIGVSFSTLYKYLTLYNIPKREYTQNQYNASIANFQKATKIRQIKVRNIDLNIEYSSKKEALQSMIDMGYSNANDWHNIRAPLDKALKNKTKTFLSFHWEVMDD